MDTKQWDNQKKHSENSQKYSAFEILFVKKNIF